MYELMRKIPLETVVVDHHIRIWNDSFDAWYASQSAYQKAEDISFGTDWEEKTMSVREAGALLGVNRNTVYALLKKKYFETVVIRNRIRIVLESFERWYAGQTHYKKVVPEKEAGEWHPS